MPEIAPQDLLTQELIGRWALDVEHTTVRIAHKTMWGLATVKGTFTVVEGAGQIEPGGALTGAIVLSAASIDTGNKKRDDHLRSADFFDVATNPTLELRIQAGTVAGDEVRLKSELTVKGIHEPQDLTARIVESTPTTVTIAVDAEVDRSRFGLTWNKGGMIKGLTRVHVDARFNRVD
jgi:polyisoprenoid-binding protein YceI